MPHIRTYLWLSQLTLLVCMLLCALIMPNVVAREGGVSNFGNHISTVGLYSLGFLANATFLYIAGTLVAQRSGQTALTASVGLKVLSAGTVVVFLSTFPRFLGVVYYEAHDILSGILYGYYFVISVWILLAAKRRSVLFNTLLLVQSIGSVLALLSAVDILEVLFLAQLTASLAFGCLLCIGLPQILELRTSA